jgi:hypothetical protein
MRREELELVAESHLGGEWVEVDVSEKRKRNSDKAVPWGEIDE